MMERRRKKEKLGEKTRVISGEGLECSGSKDKRKN